ncbi:MAG: hypothetical protein WCK06_03165 [Actinomycetota bacterium]
MAIVFGVMGAALIVLLVFLWRRRRVSRSIEVKIVDPRESTYFDSVGAVRSIQAADLTMAEGKLDELWQPVNLERLARTYWHFLSRATLGLVRVIYTPEARFVVLVTRPFVLLRFQPPEYESKGDWGLVRWRIENGLLVSQKGYDGDGYLQIETDRRPSTREGYAIAHVEVEVANFYPSIASRVGRWFYEATQSRMHVIVTHGFLRSLARHGLAESHVGRFLTADVEHGADAESSVATGQDLGTRVRANPDGN